MFCWNCGKPIDDGQKFCAVCGASQAQPAAQPAPVAEERGTEILPEPVVEERGTEILSEPEASPITLPAPDAAPETIPAPEFSVNSFAPEKPKKKKKKLGGLIAALVAVVALAGCAVFFWSYITSFWNRTFLSPEKYLVKVYEKNLEKDSMLAPITDTYGALRNTTVQTNIASQADIAISVDESLIQMLESSMGSGADLSWMQSVMMSLATNITDDGYDLSLGVGLNDTRVMTLQMIMTYAGKLYAGIPEISDTYLDAEIDAAQIQSMMTQSMAAQAELMKSLPSEEEFSALLNKYITIALAELDDVDKSTKKVHVGGLSQTYTLLEAEISEEDAVKMAIAILKEAKKDKALKKTVEAFMEYAAVIYEMQGYGTIPEDQMDVDAIFDNLDRIIDEMEMYADEADDEGILVVTTYVDMKDEICGYALETEGEEIIFFLTARKGDKFEFEAEIASGMLITGSGTEKKDVVTGKYEVEIEGQEVVVLELENFTTAENISGIVRLKPGKALAEQLASNLGNSGLGSMIDGANLALELEFGASSLDLRFVVAKKALVSLKMTYQTASNSELEIPSNTVSADSGYEISSWIRGLNFNKIVSNLEDAGVPRDIAAAIGSMLSSWQRQISNELRYY